MRASDEKLSKALREADLGALAAEAEAGDYNEFFGVHALPLIELVHNLQIARDAVTTTAQQVRIAALIAAVMHGHFDATKEESVEWIFSDEGQSVLRELAGG